MHSQLSKTEKVKIQMRPQQREGERLRPSPFAVPLAAKHPSKGTNHNESVIQMEEVASPHK